MPTYSYRCTITTCEEVYDAVATISKREEPKDCPACGSKGTGQRNWSGRGVAPMPMHASWADGKAPAGRRADVRDHVEATRLEAESYEMRPEDRGPLKKEINTILKSKD